MFILLIVCKPCSFLFYKEALRFFYLIKKTGFLFEKIRLEVFRLMNGAWFFSDI